MTNLEPFLTAETRLNILKHMLEDAPNEAVGFLLKVREGYVYERVPNISDTPQETFKVSKDHTLRATTDDEVVAIVHTHPNGPVIPSKKDMQAQVAINKPFVLGVRNSATGLVGVFSFGDHMLDYPLVGRHWHYGVFDCLEAVRSWVWQKQGKYIPRAPRNDWWWDANRQDEVEECDRNMYLRNMDDYGYREYHPILSDPQHKWHPREGDVLFMQIASPVVNHIGVYEGNNLVFHHRMNKPSGSTPLGYLQQAQYVRKWTRRKDMWDE